MLMLACCGAVDIESRMQSFHPDSIPRPVSLFKHIRDKHIKTKGHGTHSETDTGPTVTGAREEIFYSQHDSQCTRYKILWTSTCVMCVCEVFVISSGHPFGTRYPFLMLGVICLVATIGTSSAFTLSSNRGAIIHSQSWRHSVKLCATAPFDKDTDKALRATKLGFGGYPAQRYYEIMSSEGEANAFAAVREDHVVLSSWSDDQIRDAVSELKPTLSEVLIQTPIGPFLVLSAIAIFRDGLGAWGIPPCRDYVDFCAGLATAFQ